MNRGFTRKDFIIGTAATMFCTGLNSFVNIEPGQTTDIERSNRVRLDIDPATVVGRKGYYRVGKTQSGQWWLLQPDGTPFIYKGCCTIAIWHTPESNNKFGQTLKRLYGNNREAYYEDMVKLLRELGFNGFGMWSFLFSEGYPYWNLGLPFVQYIHAREIYPEATVKPPKHVDVFDPKWRTAYEKAAANACRRMRNNRNLIGYFTDNEPGIAHPDEDAVWGGREATVVGKTPLLLQCFLALPPNRPGHSGAWQWLLARYKNDIKAVATAWDAEFHSIGGVRALHDKGLAFASKGFLADNAAFTRYFIGEYQRVTGQAIRRHDPNHLILGCRHGGYPGLDVLAAYNRKYVDILSMNSYRPWLYKDIDRYYQQTGMPILNGEFSWTGMLKWNKYKSGGTFNAEELDHCRRRGIEALELAFTHPGLVGYTWYKSYGGRAPDQPGYGLLTLEGELNRFNAETLKDVHARLEGIRLGQLKPRLSGLGKFVP